ncbi:3-oxoacyl-[acyl-carrier-protein] synthase III C-terminal domain-containing protein [Streptomyces sp. NPDC047315]|uniref:3-oxoacyl-ACP synthase III family protein n=1 Tax=Streptomyces sp. NPDC047315 TaxID=3155142 RepID=UPI0033EAC281
MAVSTPAVGIVGTGSYLPHEPIDLEHYLAAGLELSPMDRGPLFRPPQRRHHVKPGDRASELIERAALPMFDRLGLDPARHVDLLLTNVLLPDDLFTGSGADTAHRLGIAPRTVLDVHNGGCASFQYMMEIAATFVGAGRARGVLVANVQNTAGQIFEQDGNRFKQHSLVAGDGCGVAYLAAGAETGGRLLGVRTRNTPSTARDIGMATDDGRHYWESGPSVLDVRFDPAVTKDTVEFGNRIVPELVRELADECGFDVADVDAFITNQPNRIFLRNWRTELDIEEERHLNTYDRYGNLYGAAVPVTLHDAVTRGRIAPGDLVVTAGFAHAGDFAAACAFRW